MQAVKEMFEEYFRERVNVLTPYVVEYGWIVPWWLGYEISSGTGMDPSTMLVGVIILEIDSYGDLRVRKGLNKSFSAGGGFPQNEVEGIRQAREYIATLKSSNKDELEFDKEAV